MNKYIVFSILYLSIQNILMRIEYDPFIKMLENIQDEVFDVTTTMQKLLKSLIIYIIVYGSILYIFIKYIVDSGTYIQAFIFGTIMYIVPDLAVLGYFHKANKHLPVLFFDIFTLGGIGLTLSLYLFRNYQRFLSNNSSYLLIFFFSTLIYFFYYSYTDTQQKLKLQEAKAKATQ